jgi:hypothetical protein
MMRVLPDRFRHNHRRVLWNSAKNLHAHFLRIDESMPLRGIERMRSFHLAPFGFQCLRQRRLHLFLFGPTFPVRGKSQIAIRDQVHLTLHGTRLAIACGQLKTEIARHNWRRLKTALNSSRALVS